MSAPQQVLASIAPRDIYYANVVSLLHFNGTDTSTTFTDQTGKSWTANGNAQIDTAQSLFGGASGLFDGSGDYLSASTGADWNWGSGDFTAELAFRVPSLPSAIQFLFTTRGTGAVVATNSVGIAITITAANKLQGIAWNAGTGVNNPVGATTISANTWHRVAYVRVGATGYLFLDGVLDASAAFTGDPSNAGTVRVGMDPSSAGPRYLNGWVDEMRMTKGVGRYTANYTPAALPFPNF